MLELIGLASYHIHVCVCVVLPEFIKMLCHKTWAVDLEVTGVGCGDQGLMKPLQEGIQQAIVHT